MKENKQIALLLGLHCHQPVDNFHHVIYDAIEKSYHPFFEVVSKYENFKFSVHYSGWLLEFIKEFSPKTFSLMQELSKKGQIEFLTGGFYEPILASISSEDRIAQITKLNDFIEDNFNQTPKGLWLTERVWNNTIIKDLIKCNIEYVVVDDYHFINAGFSKEKLHGYFLTEDEGDVLKIFPINKELRYTIPFSKPDNVCAYLESISDQKISAGVIFDDGEKFGIWPKTFEWVYKEGWLEEFIQKTLKSNTIKPMLYKDYLQICKPISLSYLPTTSYIEMGTWALTGKNANKLLEMGTTLEKEFTEDEIEKFLKGTIWKNFLIKYYEANHIHKRYMELSKEKIDDKFYLENLYKAQTNDVLWHGVFGGTYLPNLRDNAYRFIINCENIKYSDKKFVKIKDINLDGYNEAKCITKNLITIFDSKVGGQLVEWDIRDKSFNLQNCMTRYYESYHKDILNHDEVEISRQKDEIIQDGISTIHGNHDQDISQYREILKHDWHIKNSFIDHITDKSLNIKTFSQASFKEYGDFANQPFLLQNEDFIIDFTREGGIYKDDNITKVQMKKSYFIEDNQINFNIYIDGNTDNNLIYLQEHNIHFANIKNIKINDKHFEKDFVMYKTNRLNIYDLYLDKNITFILSQKTDIFISALDTLSQSESGYDLTNQGLSIGFAFKINEKINGQVEISNG